MEEVLSLYEQSKQGETMTEFDNLKRRYAATIQLGLAMNVSYQASKHGNEMLHELCKQLIENSNYHDSEKIAMKLELEILKKALEEEIKVYYQHR